MWRTNCQKQSVKARACNILSTNKMLGSYSIFFYESVPGWKELRLSYCMGSMRCYCMTHCMKPMWYDSPHGRNCPIFAASMRCMMRPHGTAAWPPQGLRSYTSSGIDSQQRINIHGESILMPESIPYQESDLYWELVLSGLK